ncbi:hypothetical protein GCM10011410_02750 [Hoyosella rhizosphaerae]|uniref:YaeQ family protein n=2 Tax=Hoyosella rhizosphaerae TaxID=1755582 RepID=A0A916U0P4_9ACTN|nr:hypothetical protein GCM10011410_02750 [Hoyosella rhizosphaerae]
MFTFTVQLSDVDRGVYEELDLRLARHPSETTEFMVTRMLAYCLEYQEGIAFSDGGVSTSDEPAVLVRDLTGQLTAWIEVGAPASDRVHRGSKRAGRAAIYTHHDASRVLELLDGKKIHRAEHIPLYSFAPDFIESAVAEVKRRNAVTVSIMERHLYFDINGTSLETPVIEHRFR